MPYGEALYDGNDKDTPAQSYKFNGKELDQETGYYYYGARYYDPTTTLWLGTDPLKHKYPDIGAYVYCAGNPVKYVDLDGRAPWDNSNIRRADRMAGSLGSGYSVERTQGKFGEDAHVMYTSPKGVKTQINYYTATQQNQKSVVVNVVEYLDEGGRADPANNGTTTTADVRAVAGYCENLSDACDIAGTGCLMTGIGAGVGGTLYTIGTVAVSVGDAINIGVDIYESKYKNAITRGLNIFVSSIFGKTIKTGNNNANKLMQKSLDKATDAFTNSLIKKNETIDN